MKLEQPEIIQVLRRRAQLNQGDFGARAFDTSFESGRTKVKNIELGRQVPTQKDLEKMAVVLGVAVSELMPADSPAAGAAAAPDNGFRVGKALLDAFPGLEDYLGMLEKAVKVDDTELIGYLADKVALLLRQAAVPVRGARKATL
jgi:hypothetical protein